MSRFTDNQDGTVTDSETGLTWTKATLAKDVTHEQALEKLEDGWRLPTIQELFSLVDHTRDEPAIDTEVFPDTENDWYWSSTPTAWNDAAVWVVDFHRRRCLLQPPLRLRVRAGGSFRSVTL